MRGLLSIAALHCRAGMVLAVPITAVLRIHLSHIYHPLPRWIAALLVGSAAVGAAAARVADASRL